MENLRSILCELEQQSINSTNVIIKPIRNTTTMKTSKQRTLTQKQMQNPLSSFESGNKLSRQLLIKLFCQNNNLLEAHTHTNNFSIEN